jgi:CRISPR-associated protein Csm4
MHYCLFRLTFRGALHIGTPRADYDRSQKIIHSDTLYAALTRAWAMVGLLPQDDKELYASFAVSSLFPFVGDYYFFPKPFLPPVEKNKNGEDRPKDAKKWKKVEWVDSAVLKQMLEGRPPNHTTEHIRWRKYHISDADALKNEKVPIESQVVPRNQVSRSGGDTKIYYIERIYFREGAGLWFMVAYEDEPTLARIRSGLEILQDEGLGTDRNVGLGQFSFQIADNPFGDFSVPDANARLSLSLFCPENEAQAEQALHYQLIRRGGWITDEGLHTFRKKNVFMFKEGSLFASPHDLIQGQTNIDLTPDVVINQYPGQHVYRCGKSIFLPCKINS